MAERDYRIVPPGEDIRIELHVLARAYQEACLALTRHLPQGRHRLERLDVTFEFGEKEEPG